MSTKSAAKLAIARKAFSQLLDDEIDRNAVSYEELPLLSCMTEDVVWQFTAADDIPIFGKDIHGKEAILELIRAENELLEKSVTLDGPAELIADDDTVVLLIKHSYKIKKSGVTVRNRMAAVVMDFRDSLICRVRFYEDFSEFAAAHQYEVEG